MQNSRNLNPIDLSFTSLRLIRIKVVFFTLLHEADYNFITASSTPFSHLEVKMMQS